MRDTAADVIDNLFSLSIKMRIFISIFFSNFPRGIVKLANIGPSNIGKFLHKLRQDLLQQFLLILVIGNHILKLLNFKFPLLGLLLILFIFQLVDFLSLFVDC